MYSNVQSGTGNRGPVVEYKNS